MKSNAQHLPTTFAHAATFWATVAVVVLAAVLRIHGLNDQGLWGDEGWSVWLARGDTLRDLTMTMVADHHGPVYSALLRGWMLLVGPQVIALRWITVLFSVTSVALIARVGRALLNPTAGVLAALAFALMDKHVVLTQEVRDYPMVYFVMLLIAYFYLRWRQSARGGWAFGFVAASVVGLYLHYYGYMVNLAVGLHALLTLRDGARWRHFLALNALIALAFAPWLPVVVHQFVGTPVDEVVLTTHGMPLNWDTVGYLAAESFGKPVALYGLLTLVGLGVPFLRRPSGQLRAIPRPRRVGAAWLAGLWLGVPLAITFGLHSRYPLLTDRNVSVIMPAIALAVGLGLTAFERPGRAFLVTLIVVNGLLTTSSYFVKPPWRQMAADIARLSLDDQPILIDVEGAHAALWYHLLLALPEDVPRIVNRLPAEAEADERAISLYDLRKRYRGAFIPHLQTILAHTDGLWLAYWGDPAKKHDVFDALETAGFVRTATRTYTHHGYPIYAYRYDRAETLAETRVAFQGGIGLQRVAVQPHEDGTVTVALWWRAEATPPTDYSVSVFLWRDGIAAQHDSYPAEGAAPTSTWPPNAYIFDAHTLTLPPDVTGSYEVRVKLYTWWDGAVLPLAEGEVPVAGVRVGEWTGP